MTTEGKINKSSRYRIAKSGHSSVDGISCWMISCWVVGIIPRFGNTFLVIQPNKPEEAVV
jgi:hypothetical protein